ARTAVFSSLIQRAELCALRGPEQRDLVLAKVNLSLSLFRLFHLKLDLNSNLGIGNISLPPRSHARPKCSGSHSSLHSASLRQNPRYEGPPPHFLAFF